MQAREALLGIHRKFYIAVWFPTARFFFNFQCYTIQEIPTVGYTSAWFMIFCKEMMVLSSKQIIKNWKMYKGNV